MAENKQGQDTYCTYKVLDPDIQKYVYVGMTSNLPRRIQQHKSKSKWWKDTLLFSAIQEGMNEEEAATNEKHWIQYYADRGHPLNNTQSMSNRQFDRMVIMNSWLGADSETSDQDKEEILLIFVKGRDFLHARNCNEDDMEWQFTPLWDHIHNAIWATAQELEKTHSIHLTHLDIARLTAKAVGLNIDDEVVG